MSSFFIFSDPSTTEIYTLSLHDALPIFDEIAQLETGNVFHGQHFFRAQLGIDFRNDHIGLILVQIPKELQIPALLDRKSTRLNSSHGYISYAVFCLKKKKRPNQLTSHHI